MKIKPILFLLFFAFVNLKADSFEFLNLITEEPAVLDSKVSIAEKVKYTTINEITENKNTEWNEIYDMKIFLEGQSKPSFMHFINLEKLVEYERTKVKNDNKVIFYKIYTEKKTEGFKDSRSKEFNKNLFATNDEIVPKYQLMLQYDFNKNPFYMDFESYKEIRNYLDSKNVKNDEKLKQMKVFIKKEKPGFKDVRVIEYTRKEIKLNETQKD